MKLLAIILILGALFFLSFKSAPSFYVGEREKIIEHNFKLWVKLAPGVTAKAVTRMLNCMDDEQLKQFKARSALIFPIHFLYLPFVPTIENKVFIAFADPLSSPYITLTPAFFYRNAPHYWEETIMHEILHKVFNYRHRSWDKSQDLIYTFTKKCYSK